MDGEEHLLFEKRGRSIRQGSEICFPGGHYDGAKDSGYLDTALREAEEELGLDRESIDVVGQLDTLVSPRGIIVECFLGVVDLPDLSSLTLDREEVDEAFTVPVSWFRHNPPEIYRNRVEIQSSYVDGEGRQRILLPVEELGLPGHYKNNRSEWMHRVVVYQRKPDIIWGLTAAVVENLVNRYLPR
jgi:8-oxo-dGTP pyrophosphatase MutT (NUDIX family)